MRFLIATGIYPPEIGGPAYYAKNLADALKAKGHEVEVQTFGKLKDLPKGIRHAALFFKMLPAMVEADVVIALDTFSAALPAYVASKIFGRPLIVRTGGDFLWEQYVERTGDLLPLPHFYERHQPFSRTERLYFFFTKLLLRSATVAFSSNFQKHIWMPVYGVEEKNTRIIQNAVTGTLEPLKPEKKNFLAYGRVLKLRNKENLRAAFAKAKEEVPDIFLEEGQVPQQVLFERIRSSYCLILPSVSDITPNYILDGLRAQKPFIMTKYSEYAELYPDLGLFVDPLSAEDISEKILAMTDPEVYERFVENIRKENFSRTYAELADDFIVLAKELMRKS